MAVDRDVLAGGVGVVASLVLHGLAAVVLWTLPAGLGPSGTPLDVELVEGSAPGEGEAASRNARRAPRAAPGGRRPAQNVDAPSPGGGGDRSGATDVIFLVERAHPITLQDSPMTAVGRAQAQRIRTAPDRATAEPRRATPHPMDTPFLASGVRDGHPERRRPAVRDARHGAKRAPEAARVGGAVERRARRPLAAEGGDRLSAPSAAQALGRPEPSPGRGILRGTGERERSAARVGHGRPPVDRGRAATPSRRREWRVRDNRDSELLADRQTQSWVQSSERSGPEPGPGEGGTGGEGPAGSAGRLAEGGRALGYGPGGGPHAALDTRGPRYQRWYLRLRRQVNEAVKFPRERLLRMDQGASVYRLVVERDGSLAEPPELLRSSRFADLDAAARRAIERSAPFAPVPAEVMGERRKLAVALTITFFNPMIR